MGVFQNNLMGAAAAAASASTDFYSYQIANSIRGSAAADTTLKFTAGTPTSSDTFTMAYWVKRQTNSTDDAANNIFVTGTGGGTYLYISLGLDLFLEGAGGNWSTSYLQTNAAYRDISAWYHHILVFDSTQSAENDRLKIYVNGERITSFAQDSMHGNIGSSEDFSFINQSGIVQAFGGLSGKGHGTEGADLSLADVMFFDGQAYYSELGETKNGVWIPKDPSGLTFGNNGYWLKFESSSDLGNDSSGNNNDFTVANFAAHDQLIDTPTFGSSNGGNYCVMNPLNSGSNNTFSEANLKVTNTSGGCSALGTMSLVTGHKWYFEGKVTGSGNNWIGIIEENNYTNSANTNSSIAGSGSFNTYLYGYNGLIYHGSSSTSAGASITTDDIIGVLVDLESATNTIQFYKNGSAQGSAFNLTGTGINYTPMSDRGSGSGNGFWFNFGQEGTFGTGSGGGNSDVNGYGDFYYDDGAAAKALCTGNLPLADAINPAETDDDYPQKLFNAKTYSGSGSTQTISGVGFQPDVTWIKNRSAGSTSGCLMDSTRGEAATNDYYYLRTDVIGAQSNTTDFHNFASDGFIVSGTGTYFNASGNNFVSWNWRVNGGTTATNSNGSVDSTVQVDPSGAFSIAKYRGGLSGAGAATVGHGLSKAPSMIIFKGYSNLAGGDGQWWVGHDELTSWNYFLRLNTDAAQVDKSGNGSMSSPTSTVFSVNNTDGLGAGTIDNIAYCFANIEGYCKTGSYKGNGNANGSYVYTGFRPEMVVVKLIDSAGDWWVQDAGRSPGNPANKYIAWNRGDAEATGIDIDILSNGFKIRTTSGDANSSSASIIYVAMAHNPFKYATAR